MITLAAIRSASLADVDAAIAAALEAYDGDAAGTLMLAAGLRGTRFPSSLVRRVVQCLDAYEAFFPIVALVSAARDRGSLEERAELIVALGEAGLLPAPVEASALLGASLLFREVCGAGRARNAPLAMWHTGSLRLQALVRIRAHDANAVERSYLALAARALGDRVGEEMARANPCEVEDLGRRVPHNLMAMLRGESLGLIRETAEAPPVIPVAMPQVAGRLGEKVGRNDPCPCGSGQKAKKCCGGARVGAGRALAPSTRVPQGSPSRPVPTHPSHLTGVPLPELARLNPTTLSADVATALLWTFNARHLWPLSERVLDGLAEQAAAKRSDGAANMPGEQTQANTQALMRKFRERPELVDRPEGLAEAARAIALDLQTAPQPAPAPSVADLRLATARQALLAGALEEAKRFARGTHPTQGFLLDLELVASGPRATVPLESVERIAACALLDVAGAGEADVQGRICDLAFTLLRRTPALGILVARGALDMEHPQYNQALVELVERARARLGLRPNDKALAHLEALNEAQGGALLKAAAAVRDTRLAGELEAARTELGAARAKAKGLQHELKKLEAATKAMESKRAWSAAVEAARAAAPGAAAPQTVGQGAASPSETGDTEEAKRLRAKVAEMKGLLREAQAERRVLRSQLAELQAAVEESEEDDEPQSEPSDEDEGDDLDAAVAPRGLLVPEFTRDAQKDLRSLPPRVARAALQAIAVLEPATGATSSRCTHQARARRGRVGREPVSLRATETGPSTPCAWASTIGPSSAQTRERSACSG